MSTLRKMVATWALLTCGAACGDTVRNDFKPADNPLRRGSEGSEDDDILELRRQGRPASIEEAENASTGLLLRVENRLEWPRGAQEAPTVVHLNVRLCGPHKPQDDTNRDYESVVNCHELQGTVNQDGTETFYLTAGEAFAVVKDADQGYRAVLQYKLTTQTPPVWYNGCSFDLHSDLDRGKQVVDVTVRQALSQSYKDELHTTYTPSASL